MANEPRKAEIVAMVVNDPATDRLPASLLADHPDLTFYLDRAASAGFKV